VPGSWLSHAQGLVDVEEDFTRLLPPALLLDGTIAAWSATSGQREAMHTSAKRPD
jgi:hypothetical protein